MIQLEIANDGDSEVKMIQIETFGMQGRVWTPRRELLEFY
jgi:hypothetical protein